jgi:hypothetical protein
MLPAGQIISRGRSSFAAIAGDRRNEFREINAEQTADLPPKNETQRNFRTNAKQNTNLNVNGV